MDDAEATLTMAIIRTAELFVLPQECRRPGRGWSRDAQTEAELQAAAYVMHEAGQCLKTDTRHAQLQGTVRYAYVCMVITYSKSSMDQSGKVGNPARGQLNRETEYFLVSRDRFGYPVPRPPAQLHTQAEAGA